jgi:hypothetical protein
VPFILARHKDKSPDLRPILADTFRETQAISRIAINRPISDALAGTGNPDVFLHTLRRAENSCVIAESCLSRRGIEEVSSECGVNPTFLGIRATGMTNMCLDGEPGINQSAEMNCAAVERVRRTSSRSTQTENRLLRRFKVS